MPTSVDNVTKLYAQIANREETRLADHPMERELTLRCIRKYLGQGSSRIADIGGGPGKLAFPLADNGHRIDLVDLSPALVERAQAEQKRRQAEGKLPLLKSIVVGNALESPVLGTGDYDAVLLLGPMYHLIEESERAQALRNALELASPNGGLVFVAFVTMAAHLRDVAMRKPEKLLEKKGFYAKYLTDGRYETVRESEGMNVQCFHSSPRDVRRFLERHASDSLELIELRSTEGILGGNLDASLAKASDELVQAWADLMFEKFSTNEEDLGCADHLLAVLRRK